MIRLPLIAAVTAGLLIGVLPPATAAASPASSAAAMSSSTAQSTSPDAHGQGGAATPIGTPASLTTIAANLRLLPTFLENVDRHR